MVGSGSIVTEEEGNLLLYGCVVVGNGSIVGGCGKGGVAWVEVGVGACTWLSCCMATMIALVWYVARYSG